jgi:hypothetical protein
MRLVCAQVQDPQPLTNRERDLADHDVKFLLSYLAHERGTTYRTLARPDERERNKPAPDYLFLEFPSQRRVAVEHAKLMRRDLQRTKARAVKAGALAVMEGPRAIDPGEVVVFLEQFLAQKIGRGQLGEVQADERIILLRNRLLATARTFMEAPVLLPPVERGPVDHAFLIASRKLLQIW